MTVHVYDFDEKTMELEGLAFVRHTAQVLGITGAVGWCSVGALNPVVGKIADHFQSFTPSIVVLACLPLIGAFIGLAWPRPQVSNAS